MKKNYFLAATALVLSLFIYMFYRTEKTVVNEMAIALFSPETFSAWKSSIVSHLPLHEHIIYSLPEGLWVFSITLTSKPFFVPIAEHNIKLLYLPLIFSLGLELLQLLHISNGRFDGWDIGVSLLFWLIAAYGLPQKVATLHILRPFSIHSAACIVNYGLVWLAHVWRN